jgi:hypothetical protein
MNYVRATLRFWWLALAGLAVASSVLLLMLYRVDRAWPPALVTKAVPSFLATTELLVDSPTGPYFRTATARQTPVKILPGKGSPTPAVTTNQTSVAPTKPLVDAANLFPLFIESDAVARLRAERFGIIPGFVRAKALYAVQGQNRYRPSMLPVMQISAVSLTPNNAIRLAEATARAFGIWLTREQKSAKVPLAQRIVMRQLRVPQTATKLGGTHYGLPALLALGLLAAFLGLAVVADHVFPRRELEIAALPGVAGAEGEVQPSLTVASRSQSS